VQCQDRQTIMPQIEPQKTGVPRHTSVIIEIPLFFSGPDTGVNKLATQVHTRSLYRNQNQV
jgi:hypothetical protein